jgi:hypothetical protein
MLKRRICAILLGVLVLSTAAPAQIDPQNFLGRLGNKKYSIDYDFAGTFREGAEDQNTEVGWTQQEIRGLVPISQSDRHELSGWMKLGALDLCGDMRLPDSGEDFPNELYDVQLGVGGRYKLDNDWIVGGMFGFGSPSDKPFASVEEVTVNANLFLEMPFGKGKSWLFLLNYANNREFLPHVPLPGFAFNYRPDENLHVIAGAPFSMIRWRPASADAFELSASYFFLRTVHAKVSYEFMPDWKVYVGFDWQNDRWYRHDRYYDDDRLFLVEKRVNLGVRWDVSEDIYIDAFGGYGFNRFWFEGDGFDQDDRNRIDISDGMLAGLRAGVKF